MKHMNDHGYGYIYEHVKFRKCRLSGMGTWLYICKNKKEMTSKATILKCSLDENIVVYFIHDYQGCSNILDISSILIKLNI